MRLEGPSGGLWSNLLLQAGSAVSIDQVAQGLVHQSTENLQGQRLYNLIEQLVLVLDCPHHENVFSSMQDT